MAQRRLRENADRGGFRGERGTGEFPYVWTAIPRQARLPRRAVPGWQHLAALRRRRGLRRCASLHGQTLRRHLRRLQQPMMARRWRILRALPIAALALLLIAFFVGWYLFAGSRARLDGTRAAAGLSAPVGISRDALGTVTFDGRSRADISYALGYVHAQERFFEMDLMRRMPAGELSALVGPAALKVDLNHRRHRLRAVAEAAYAQLPPAQKHALDRYRDGVNAGF